MRKFLAGSALAMMLSLGGLGLGATTAHAEGKTITVEQSGYTYSCSTEVQEKQSMQIKVDGVQYTCYSPEREASNNSNTIFAFVLFGGLLLFGVLMLLATA